MRSMKIAGAAATLLALPWVAQAQDACVSGVVMDPSGARLVGAEVTLTQTQRNLRFEVESGGDGRFLLPRLPIGELRGQG